MITPSFDSFEHLIDSIPDDELNKYKFMLVPGSSSPVTTEIDGDGFTRFVSASSTDGLIDRKKMQDECWNMFQLNPHVNTSVRGMAGRLTGNGFGVYSEIFEIQEKLRQITTDPRNRHYSLFPKYVARALVEGELFLNLTLHTDGFVETDFIDPTDVSGGLEEGVYWHPTKPMMPLLFEVNDTYIPSIYLAYYPELIKQINKEEVNDGLFKKMESTKNKKKFPKTEGYSSFVVCWDKSFLTKRTASYLMTTIQWLNYYESLKKYEIDHKKSSGSYLWTFSFENIKDFKNWLKLTDEEKRSTGILAKKVPGGSLILPPGIKCDVKNPNLNRITDQDNDILHMISAGLNEPEDIMTGKQGGTFASVKATRGPMSDRVSDEIAEFENFLIYDFWRPIFFLMGSTGKFKKTFPVTECVGYKEETVIVKIPVDNTQGMADNAVKEKSVPQKPQFEEKEEQKIVPVYKTIKREPHELIVINFPISENIDYEARAKGLLGVKHGSVTDVLGISKSEVAGRLGLKNYGYLRMIADTEKKRFPETIMNIDQESLQERTEAEPKVGVVKNGKRS